MPEPGDLLGEALRHGAAEAPPPVDLAARAHARARARRRHRIAGAAAAAALAVAIPAGVVAVQGNAGPQPTRRDGPSPTATIRAPVVSGCAPTLAASGLTAGTVTFVSVCRYDGEGRLRGGMQLDLRDSLAVALAVRRAPVVDAAARCVGPLGDPVVVLLSQGLDAHVDLVSRCVVVAGEDRPRSLTPGLLRRVDPPGAGRLATRCVRCATATRSAGTP